MSRPRRRSATSDRHRTPHCGDSPSVLEFSYAAHLPRDHHRLLLHPPPTTRRLSPWKPRVSPPWPRCPLSQLRHRFGGTSRPPCPGPGPWLGGLQLFDPAQADRHRPHRRARAFGRIIGAVNYVVATDDGLIGHNTDGQGFVAAPDAVRDTRRRPYRGSRHRWRCARRGRRDGDGGRGLDHPRGTQGRQGGEHAGAYVTRATGSAGIRQGEVGAVPPPPTSSSMRPASLRRSRRDGRH